MASPLHQASSLLISSLIAPSMKQSFSCGLKSKRDREGYRAMKMGLQERGEHEICRSVSAHHFHSAGCAGFILLVILWFTREPSFIDGWATCSSTRVALASKSSIRWSPSGSFLMEPWLSWHPSCPDVEAMAMIKKVTVYSHIEFWSCCLKGQTTNLSRMFHMLQKQPS